MTNRAGDQFAIHEHPVWRDRADFIIAAPIVPTAPRPVRQWEQLWARRRDATRFEICCNPFFIYDLALANVVECEPAGGRQFVVQRVTAPAGHFTLRAWFGQAPSLAIQEEVVAAMESIGAVLEWLSPNLLAIDAVDEAMAQAVADDCCPRHRAGTVIFETGRTR